MAPTPGKASSPSRPAGAPPTSSSFSFRVAGRSSPGKHGQTPSAPQSAIPPRRQLTVTRLPDPNRMHLPTRRLSMAALGEPQPTSASAATSATVSGRLPQLASSTLGKRAKKDSTEDVENEAAAARNAASPSSVDEFGRRNSRSPTTARTPPASLSSSRRRALAGTSAIPASPSSKALANKVARSGSNADVHAASISSTSGPPLGIPRLRTNSTLSAIPRAATSSDLSPRRAVQPATLGIQPRSRQRSSVTSASFTRPASRDGSAAKSSTGPMGPPSVPFYGSTSGNNADGNMTAPQSVSRPVSSTGSAAGKLVRRASDAGLRPRPSGELRRPTSATSQAAEPSKQASQPADGSSNPSKPASKPRQSVVIAPLRRKAANTAGPPNSFSAQHPLSSSLAALQKNANVKARTAAWEAGTPSPPPASYRHLAEDTESPAPATPDRMPPPFADMGCFDTPQGGDKEELPELASPEVQLAPTRHGKAATVDEQEKTEAATPKEQTLPLPAVAALRRTGIAVPKQKVIDTPEAKARGARRLSGLREGSSASGPVSEVRSSPLRTGIKRPSPGKRGAAIAQLAASSQAAAAASSSSSSPSPRAISRRLAGAGAASTEASKAASIPKPSATPTKSQPDSGEEELMASLRLMARKAGISIEKVQSMMRAESATSSAPSSGSAEQGKERSEQEQGMTNSPSWATLATASPDVSGATAGNEDEEAMPTTKDVNEPTQPTLEGSDPTKRFSGPAFTQRQPRSSLSVVGHPADETMEVEDLGGVTAGEELDLSLVMALQASHRSSNDDLEDRGEEAKSSSGPDESFRSAPMSPVKAGGFRTSTVSRATPAKVQVHTPGGGKGIKTPSTTGRAGGARAFRPRESVRLEDGLASLSALRLSDLYEHGADRGEEGEGTRKSMVLLTEDDTLLEDLDEAVRGMGLEGLSPLPSMMELPRDGAVRRNLKTATRKASSSTQEEKRSQEAEMEQLRAALEEQRQRAEDAEELMRRMEEEHQMELSDAMSRHEASSRSLQATHLAEQDASHAASRSQSQELGRAIAEVAKSAAREAGGIARGEALELGSQGDVARFLLAQCTVWERSVWSALQG